MPDKYRDRPHLIMLGNSSTKPPVRPVGLETVAAAARTTQVDAVRPRSMPRPSVPGHEAADLSRTALLREAIGDGTYPLNPWRIAAGLMRMERTLTGHGAAVTTIRG